MKLSDFNYHLPKKLIAQSPLRPRDSSRLFIIKGKRLDNKKFRDIIGYLQEGDVLVLNNTKVMPNKLYGKKKTGSRASIIIEAREGELYRARVECKNPYIGSILEFKGGLKAEIAKKEKDIFWLKFNKAPEPNLKKHGVLPTPNYMKARLKRKDHYQTAFAEKKGSLAAPTSGLHFTKALLEKIKRKGVKIVYVTLHISFGTFRCIDEGKPFSEHRMDPECYSISKKAAYTINSRKGRLVVCGTTAFKTLESAADEDGKIADGQGSSSLFIYPGHNFRVRPDMLITNFHLPKSTLILFVSAYFGKDIVLNAYNEAIKERYRFFSLGDACLFLR